MLPFLINVIFFLSLFSSPFFPQKNWWLWKECAARETQLSKNVTTTKTCCHERIYFISIYYRLLRIYWLYEYNMSLLPWFWKKVTRLCLNWKQSRQTILSHYGMYGIEKNLISHLQSLSVSSELSVTRVLHLEYTEHERFKPNESSGLSWRYRWRSWIDWVGTSRPPLLKMKSPKRGNGSGKTLCSM